MPELPEVETIVRDLRPHITGVDVSEVIHIDARVLRGTDPGGFRSRVEGRKVSRVDRRGKFIHLVLGPDATLIVHLGMSGTLTLEAEPAAIRPHTHLRLRLAGVGELRYRDPRRFGRVALGRPEELLQLGALPRLGAEPLARGFATTVPLRLLLSSRRSVKAILLDQGVVAGCGNIYADEACFLAGIRPARKGCRTTAAEWRRVLLALAVVMREAIRRRGTSFSDYRDGFGARGEAFEALMVYGRAGSPCVRCGAALVRAQIAGRTTVYCARCQR